MFNRNFLLGAALITLAGCTTTEAEKDAKFSTPRIPLSDGTLFTQRATPASTCREKYAEIKRVNNIIKQDGFVNRGKGEKLIYNYQLRLVTDIMETCRDKIIKGHI
ncbi:hypothetical protein [Pseudochrobactrum kiredjianiae]|uniref:Lipoprotein n=1 Tax=Pseudochrobactrum kiredjianiae TaxID=386305 RepID=A0ABW3V3U4_9HYPH|nr:hypothetical protein [Pseudochrobactrum kiredjianiae]MDM7851163.1 hypothetical protein [Pseudochrobactrum kiredjianiae]